MSWLGLRHKGVEVLYPEEWNAVVDGLDLLKYYTDQGVKKSDLEKISSDVKPSEDNKYNLGGREKNWKEVHAYYGYFNSELYVQNKPVLKDGDPVITKQFIDEAKQDIENIYNLAKQPQGITPWIRNVGKTPIPLSDVDMLVKRIHVKVPSWAFYLVYLGNDTDQSYILEPGDKDVFEVSNPKNIYVKSIGNVTIYVAVEQ